MEKTNLALVLMLSFGIFLFVQTSQAQNKPEKPPKPIKLTVYTLQHLEFGRIIPMGSPGYVTVPPSGVPTSNSVILLSSPARTPAIIDVESLPGTRIQIGFPSSVTLTCSGVGTLNLRDLTCEPGGLSHSFISDAGGNTRVYIGGTLDVNLISVNPAGSYGGTFTVTFTQIYQ